MELLTAAEMREADREAIVGMKIPSLRLMEKAGNAVAREAGKLIGRSRTRPVRIAVVCGRGNNGGDGLVAARLLHRMGCRVSVFLVSPDFSKDAAAQFKRLPRRIHVHRIFSIAVWKKEMEKLAQCGLIIDALFGTGLSQPVKGFLKRIVEDINRTGLPVLAVDIASGIDATTGAVLGAAVRADVTVTFARLKIGQILFPGAAHCGRLVVADIGIPDRAIERTRPHTFLLTAQDAASLLPLRPDHSHKGTFGQSVILAGSRGMIGAAVLAAEAAMRIGSGITRLCVPQSVYSIAARKLPPEAMCAPVPDGGRGLFGPESVRPVLKYLDRATCVLIGPGIGRDRRTIRWLARILKHIASGRPAPAIILDADALFAPAFLPRGCVITPHAGEMARLMGWSRAAVDAGSCEAARNFAMKNGLTVVLKGSRTKIANPKGLLFINHTGNAALAKGATGDVLAGLTCGLGAQGLASFDAARLAVYLQGRAADIAVDRGRDKRTFLASDIFAHLDPALAELSGRFRKLPEGDNIGMISPGGATNEDSSGD